jgi:hypothetical protein
MQQILIVIAGNGRQMVKHQLGSMNAKLVTTELEGDALLELLRQTEADATVMDRGTFLTVAAREADPNTKPIQAIVLMAASENSVHDGPNGVLNVRTAHAENMGDLISAISAAIEVK